MHRRPRRRFVTFVDIEQPKGRCLRWLRNFSAPVIVRPTAYDERRVCSHLHEAYDSDAFNRWEAGQRLALSRLLAASSSSVDAVLDAEYIEAMGSVLRAPDVDAAFKALALVLPSEVYVAEQMSSVDPQRIHTAREAMKRQLAVSMRADWQRAFDANETGGAYSPDAASAGRRALANLALAMLCLAEAASADDAATSSTNRVWSGRALQRFKDASNMTDRQGALAALLGCGSELADRALERFHDRFQHEPLVIDTWFRMQATAPEHDGRVFARVGQLLSHADFSLTNPNRARSLIGAFCRGNPAAFHRTDGAGYAFWADRVIEIDRINAQLASRTARALDRWAALAEPYRSAAREAIARVAAQPQLSSDTREIVSRALTTN